MSVEEDLAFDSKHNKWCAPFAVMLFGLFVILMLMYGIDIFNPPAESSAPADQETPAAFDDGCNYAWGDFVAPVNPLLAVTTSVDAASWPHRTVSAGLASANPADGERFADKYRVVTVDSRASIIDAETGAIIAYNLETTGGISFRADSKLLYINVGESDGGYDLSDEYSRDIYMLNRDNHLELICVEPPESTPDEYCNELPLTIASDATRERWQTLGSCNMPSQNWGIAVGPKATDASYWEAIK